MIWLLLLTISTAGVQYVGGPPTERVLVSSPEAAAVRLWECNQGTIWRTCHGALYAIDIETGTLRPTAIPLLTFEKRGDPDPPILFLPGPKP